jgi:hypothetical protein
VGSIALMRFLMVTKVSFNYVNHFLLYGINKFHKMAYIWKKTMISHADKYRAYSKLSIHIIKRGIACL